jgi:hypothetical protein
VVVPMLQAWQDITAGTVVPADKPLAVDSPWGGVVYGPEPLPADPHDALKEARRARKTQLQKDRREDVRSTMRLVQAVGTTTTSVVDCDVLIAQLIFSPAGREVVPLSAALLAQNTQQ